MDTTAKISNQGFYSKSDILFLIRVMDPSDYISKGVGPLGADPKNHN